ncbi:MAG: hypothetical protein IJB27_01985 [Clostridia bacterium]|nr:hypothetical protein [Clostridia bacterium]
MSRSCVRFARVAAAFGIGVLLSILIPSEWMLIVALLTLIALAVGCSACR